MNIDELIASYDSIDYKYMAKFQYGEERSLYIDDRGGHVGLGRKMDSSYMSFIPGEEELDKILLEPLRRMKSVQ